MGGGGVSKVAVELAHQIVVCLCQGGESIKGAQWSDWTCDGEAGDLIGLNLSHNLSLPFCHD